MAGANLHVVTGAFGYSGRYIARRLLDEGHEVRTLTNSMPRHDPFCGRVAAQPLAFDDRDRLCRALDGAAVLYNTYWVRFSRCGFTHEAAVGNTLKLFAAARAAGVGRIVHLSVTNASEDSGLEYFRGKGVLERALKESGIPHAILRPTVLFGTEDILVNNIAWLLRRLPVFGIFGDGSYRLQPIFVDDLAKLAVEVGKVRGNLLVDAIGPETFTYRALVDAIGTAIGKRRPIVSIPPAVGYAAGILIGKLVGDVLITREEIEGLTAGLLCVDSEPAGTIRFTDWARENASTLGARYASELSRRMSARNP